MAIPLIPIMTALAAGGSLVPHAAGGLMVSSATAGGYVAGTYLGTTAATSIVEFYVEATTSLKSSAMEICIFRN